MKTFYLVTNQEKEDAARTEGFIADYLNGHGAVCYLKSQEKGAAGRYTDPGQVPAGVDCVITIGGDGTLIQAARDLVERSLPLIGINRGHLGYLTQVSEEKELIEMLNALLKDNYHLESRMMLTGKVVRAGRTVASDLALNEILVGRRQLLKALHFRISVNGQFLNDYTADGMIIATPTGSTAYNLSAGGPIISPAAKLMVMTPICSHALNARSIVLASEDEILIEPLEDEQMLAFDGNPAGDLSPGDRIYIARAQAETKLIQLKKVSFLQHLSSKMVGV